MYIDERGYKRYSDNEREHHKIAERALGRKLKSREIVHHLDYNKHNNSNDSLIICDRKYHMLIHARTDCIRAGFSPNTHSRCSFHKKYEPVINFSKDLSQWNGLRAVCREAAAAYSKSWRSKEGTVLDHQG